MTQFMLDEMLDEADPHEPKSGLPVFTPRSLALEVERLVNADHLTYVEAIIAICDKTGIDPEDIGKLVQGPLKDKVEAEARKMNVLPRGNTLFDDEDE